jgi:hypothetical protein
MKLSRLLLSFGTLALAIASAATKYNFSLFEPSFVAGQELKPGDYKLELNGDKVMIKVGKQIVEAPVKVENAPEKFDGTSVRYADANGHMNVTEIRIGGTYTKLIFNNN